MRHKRMLIKEEEIRDKEKDVLYHVHRVSD